MSLDLYISEKPCDKCGHSPDQGFSWNYTYNLSPLWYHIMPDDDKMIAIEGMTGAEALPKIQKAMLAIENGGQELDKFNSPNGWGSVNGFLIALQELERACIKYPDGVWRAAR